PVLHRDMAQAGAQLDEGAARDLINDFRARNGAGPLRLNRRLTRLAQAHAHGLAESARRGDPWAPHARLKERVAAVNYDMSEIGEAVGSGYSTIARAFSGWRDSPEHRKIMLLPSASEMGIAVVHRPGTRHGLYWVLVVARPA